MQLLDGKRAKAGRSRRGVTFALMGIPLFTNATFNASGQTRNLYTVAAEWQLTATNTVLHGDNWLLVADWSVRAVPIGENPVRIRDVGVDSAGTPQISWFGEQGFTYQVQGAEDIGSWQTNLPGSVFSGLLATQTLVYTDALFTNQSVRSPFGWRRQLARARPGTWPVDRARTLVAAFAHAQMIDELLQAD